MCLIIGMYASVTNWTLTNGANYCNNSSLGFCNCSKASSKVYSLVVQKKNNFPESNLIKGNFASFHDSIDVVIKICMQVYSSLPKKWLPVW